MFSNRNHLRAARKRGAMDRIEAADFHDVVQVADPRVSPDGDEVAFLRTEPDDEESYESTVYLSSVGGDATRRFSIAEGSDSQPRWSPSGDRIAFVSTRGADDDRPQLWVVPTDGGEGRQVTEVAGGVSGIAWSPDGTRVAFTQGASEEDVEEDRDLTVPEEFEPETPDPRVVDRTVWRSMQRWFDGKRSQVYVVDLADDEVQRLTDEDADHNSPEWGDDGTLYYTVSRGDPDPDDSLAYDIVAHDVDDDETEVVHTTTGWGVGLAASEDGRVAHVFVEEDQASLRQSELHVVDAEGGDVAHPTASLDRTLGFGAAPQWGPDEDLLYFSTPDEGAGTLWEVPWDGDDPDRVLREDWASLDGAHVGDDVVAFVRSDWDHPGDVFVATRGGAEEQRLTRVNADYLEDRAVARPEELSFANGDTELQGWVLTPPDFEEDEQYPLAVEVHGGPHAMWTTSGTMWHEFQTLAARGYVVFWSNPRGSSGYGEEFMGAIERDWGDVTMGDVMAGVEQVAERDYVDEDDAFLTGGSFGGYMTGWMVGHTDYFSGAVAQRGVFDLTGFYGSTDGAYTLVEGDFDTTPWEEPEFLWEHSPTGHAHEVDTPTLVVHSDDDYRTPANTADLFYRILRKHEVDTRMVRYPGEGHELSRSGQPGHVVDRIERIVRWFDGYSGHHDAERALDRPEDDGLTAGEDEDDEDGESDDD
jgi:dipeptidyl aminopeptidase/acylaminoacyl peptidase